MSSEGVGSRDSHSLAKWVGCLGGINSTLDNAFCRRRLYLLFKLNWRRVIFFTDKTNSSSVTIDNLSRGKMLWLWPLKLLSTWYLLQVLEDEKGSVSAQTIPDPNLVNSSFAPTQSFSDPVTSTVSSPSTTAPGGRVTFPPIEPFPRDFSPEGLQKLWDFVSRKTSNSAISDLHVQKKI